MEEEHTTVLNVRNKLSTDSFLLLTNKIDNVRVYRQIRVIYMETMNLSKKRFDSLELYKLPASVFNTEAKLYVLPVKNRWETVNKILKKLYITNGPMFGNKLQTINSLIDLKDEIDMEEIVFPEKLAVINQQVVGYIMELINSINLGVILNSPYIKSERKVNYLRQVGEIIEKMKKVRNYTSVKDFYLNDLHENNFVVDIITDKVKVVDIDSCKINGNYTFPSKYLTEKSFANSIRKYEHEKNQVCGGIFIPSYDTEIYCYVMLILNTLYGGGINRIPIQEFYNYLDYLKELGVDINLIINMERVLTNSHNINPYENLESLTSVIGKAHQNVYKKVKNK